MNHKACEVSPDELQQRSCQDAVTKDEKSPPVLSSSPPVVQVIIEKDCFWIRNALSMDEQIEVFGDILERSKYVDNTQKTRCMNPTPKTIIFNGHKSTLSFGKQRKEGEENENAAKSSSISSVYDELILRRAISIASQHFSEKQRNQTNTAIPAVDAFYNRYSVGVIRYDAPNGSFPVHIDHCNDPNGWVFLLSLGCKARFSVQKGYFKKAIQKGNGSPPTTLDNNNKNEKFQLELNSGDIMVFDPSSEAAILHGVTSILPSTCPEALIQAFGEKSIANLRYGVQCRASLEE